MVAALYPGSFDPPTRGHIDLVARALPLFDSLTVAVGRNREKSALFAVDERVEMLREVLPEDPRLRIATFDGLAVDFCAEHDIGVIVRGLRTVTDFEFERQMAQTNRGLNPRVETVLMMPDPALTFISSSLIKDVVRYGGPARDFLPPRVEELLRARLAERG